MYSVVKAVFTDSGGVWCSVAVVYVRSLVRWGAVGWGVVWCGMLTIPSKKGGFLM